MNHYSEPPSASSKSRFWNPLWEIYANAPSTAFCRIPELEYAAKLEVAEKRILDHCCGDGVFASLAWPGQTLSAGCDLNPRAIEKAQSRGVYIHTDVCDVSQRLPYEDAAFDMVFNNSALEHIKDVNAVLAEISRVLAQGGIFAFNVLNHRYFEWWPLDEKAAEGYKDWQPFYHALNLSEWRQLLQRSHLEISSVNGYFDRDASRMLARLDCEFSGFYNAQRPSRLVKWYFLLPRIMKAYWQWRLSSLTWKTEPDAGAGYFIQAIRA